MNERRATSRQRVFKAGTIEFEGTAVDCLIRNVSAAGAALQVSSPVGIPHEITLNILTRNERQHCYIIWRKKTRIGVVFR
jgi:hypothetical protein